MDELQAKRQNEKEKEGEEIAKIKEHEKETERLQKMERILKSMKAKEVEEDTQKENGRSDRTAARTTPATQKRRTCMRNMMSYKII